MRLVLVSLFVLTTGCVHQAPWKERVAGYRQRHAAACARLTPASKPCPECSKDSPEGAPVLSKPEIKTLIESRISEVRACYEEALDLWPEVTGRVITRFIIDAKGEVPAVGVVSNSTEIDEIGCCIADAMRHWRFPEPRGKGIVVVTYPYELRVKR